MVPPGLDPEKDDIRTRSPTTAHNTDRSEPPDEDLEEKDSTVLSPHKDNKDNKVDSDSLHSISESLHGEEKQVGLVQAQTYATTASAATAELQVKPKKKPWYKYYNPLRWGGIPPVPESRSVSREYSAPFLSLVYFQWIAPIMSVRTPRPGSTLDDYLSPGSHMAGLTLHRLATNGPSKKMTSGR